MNEPVDGITSIFFLFLQKLSSVWHKLALTIYFFNYLDHFAYQLADNTMLLLIYYKIYWRADIRFLALTCWSSVLITAANVYLYATYLCKKKHLSLYSCFPYYQEHFFLPVFSLRCFRCKIENIATTEIKGQWWFSDIWGASPLYFPRGELFLI